LDETEEIKRWVLSFGENAVVQEPASMRNEMRSTAEELLRQYGCSETPP